MKICPELINHLEHLDSQNNDPIELLRSQIIRTGVGFRPARKGGVRLEIEIEEYNDKEKYFIIHNYGHAGYGM